MRRFPRYLFTTLVTVAVSVVVLAVSGAILRNRVTAVLAGLDSRVSVAGVTGSPEAILLTGVSFPSRGVMADSVWILLEGFPFRTEAVEVVISGATVTRVEELREEAPGPDAGRRQPPVSILDGTLITGGQSGSLFARHHTGRTLFQVRGAWGNVWGERSAGQGVFVVFRDCTGFPGMPGLPGMLAGNSFCGTAHGRRDGPGAALSGTLTGFNGTPVSVPFNIGVVRGRPSFGIVLDLAQVEPELSRIVREVTGGMVTWAGPEGTLAVSTSGGDTLDFAFDISFPGIRVGASFLAADTVEFPLAISGTGAVIPREGAFHVREGSVSIGEACCGYTLSGRWGARRLLSVSLFSDSLAGGDLTAAIPAAVLGRLQGLRLSGSLAFHVSLTLDWDDPDSSDVSVSINPGRLRVEHSPVNFGRLATPCGETVLMRDSWGNSRVVALDSLAGPGFAPQNSFPPWLEPLLCAAEDGTFRRHSGFSEYHLRNSIRADMSQGRFVRGGSTISMQLVKNLFLGREKTLARKLQEVFLTWRMESYLSKDRILELYVNVVELGPGVFGFREAAGYYFGTTLEALSVRETAFLVSILPGPRLYHRFGASGTVPGYWNDYLDRLICAAEGRTGLQGGHARRGLSETLVFDGRVAEH